MIAALDCTVDSSIICNIRQRVLDGEESQRSRRTRSPQERSRSPRDKSSGTEASPRSSRKTRTAKSIETDVPTAKGDTIIPLPTDSDPLTEMDKIPFAEKLETLDPLSRYEYKIHTICLLEKILTRDAVGKSPTTKGERSPKKMETTFLRLAPELLFEALQERYS